MIRTSQIDGAIAARIGQQLAGLWPQPAIAPVAQPLWLLGIADTGMTADEWALAIRWVQQHHRDTSTRPSMAHFVDAHNTIVKLATPPPTNRPAAIERQPEPPIEPISPELFQDLMSNLRTLFRRP
jgi:hypothetical protein